MPLSDFYSLALSIDSSNEKQIKTKKKANIQLEIEV